MPKATRKAPAQAELRPTCAGVPAYGAEPWAELRVSTLGTDRRAMRPESSNPFGAHGPSGRLSDAKQILSPYLLVGEPSRLAPGVSQQERVEFAI
jgi:hypothetical protein